MPMASRGRVPTCASAKRVNQSSAPVRTSAPINRNIAAIVQGAGLDKTAMPAS